MIALLVWILSIFTVLIAIAIQSLFSGLVVLIAAAALAYITHIPLTRVYPPKKQQAIHSIIAGTTLILASIKNLVIKQFLAQAQLTQDAIAFNLSQIDVILLVVGYFCTAYILTARQQKLLVD